MCLTLTYCGVRVVFQQSLKPVGLCSTRSTRRHRGQHISRSSGLSLRNPAAVRRHDAGDEPVRQSLKPPTCQTRLRPFTAVLVAQPNRQAQGLFPTRGRVGGHQTVLSCQAGALAVEQVYHKSVFLAIGRAKQAARVRNVEPNIAPPRALLPPRFLSLSKGKRVGFRTRRFL